MLKMSEFENKRSRIICITGKIGSGKTTTSNILSEWGYNIFIVDKWVHEIYKVNQIGYQLIKENFGVEYINDIEVDRSKLKELILKDESKKELLDRLLQPLIKNKILALRDKRDLYFVELGIYLLNPKYFDECFDNIILIKRKNIIKNPLNTFLDNIKIESNWVIYNDNDIEFLKRDLKKIIKDIK